MNRRIKSRGAKQRRRGPHSRALRVARPRGGDSHAVSRSRYTYARHYMKRAENSWLFKYSRWDAIPVLTAVGQFTYLLMLFFTFSRLPLWVLPPLGFIWAVSISWNINGISHNFLHNAYFRSAALNRTFSVLESVTVGFSQVFYEQVHKDHHKGNADLPDASGRTRDPLSIYKHGRDGRPENPWTYVFGSYFRDDPKAIYRSIHRKAA